MSVALLDALGDAFGARGVQRVLESRCARQRADYAGKISPSASLKEKLQQLARVRTDGEGLARFDPGLLLHLLLDLALGPRIRPRLLLRHGCSPRAPGWPTSW